MIEGSHLMYTGNPQNKNVFTAISGEFELRLHQQISFHAQSKVHAKSEVAVVSNQIGGELSCLLSKTQVKLATAAQLQAMVLSRFI